jgi:ribosome recycling factor
MANDAKSRMTAVVEALRRDLATLGGRAHPSLLDPVRVDAYGSPTSLPQVASVSAPEPRLLAVQVWDRNLVGAVEKAILKANLGLTPSVDGQTVRLRLPIMSEERRREIVRTAKARAEEARVKVRGIRRDAIDRLKRLQADGRMKESTVNGETRRIQEQTDEHVAQIDALLKAREAEIMAV